MGPLLPEVEPGFILVIVDVAALFFVKIFSGLLEYVTEEKSWCKHTTLFYSIRVWEGLWEVEVKSDLAMLVLVQ